MRGRGSYEYMHHGRSSAAAALRCHSLTAGGSGLQEGHEGRQVVGDDVGGEGSVAVREEVQQLERGGGAPVPRHVEEPVEHLRRHIGLVPLEERRVLPGDGSERLVQGRHHAEGGLGRETDDMTVAPWTQRDSRNASVAR